MGKGRKIEDWFDRKIAKSRDLDKLPREMKKSISSRIKFPASVFEREKAGEEPSSAAKKPSVKGIRELNLGERFSRLRERLPIPELKRPLKEKREEAAEPEAPETRYNKIRTGDLADLIVENPIPALGLMVLITIFFFFQALSINMDDFPVPFDNNLNIHGETTVYLPSEHETTEILEEVREYWSTDIIVIFVQIDKPDENTVNISDPTVLREMDYVEETLDWDKSDRGKNDEIIYCFSLSTLIKEVNSTAPRLYNATLKNGAAFLSQQAGYKIDEEIVTAIINIDPVGNYSIPNSQDEIDSIVNNLPENVRDMMVRDTSGNGIWDTAVIVMGVVEEAGDNPKPMIELSEKTVDERPRIGNNTIFTVTGTLPLTDFVTGEAFRYYGVLVPLALIFLVSAILYFHRSIKAVLIAGIPTGSSVVWIYGFLALTDTIVTPTIIILGPVLLALGMSYGMHIANRFSQETHPSFTERARITMKTTGNAVLMSAVTTMVGFGALAYGDLKPVTTVGWSLTMGIFFCFLLTYFMSPAICILTKYEKKTLKTQSARWKKLGQLPTRNSKKILAFMLLFILISLSMYPLVEKDTDLMAYAPDRDTEIWGTKIEGFEKIEVMKTYSDEFDSGALGMVVIKGMLRSDDYENDAEDPVANLKEIDEMEKGINAIRKNHPELPVHAIGLVSILKSIGGKGTITTKGTILEEVVPLHINLSQDGNFWAVLNHPFVASNKPLQKFLLNVFYDTLSNESRGMVINEYVEGEDEYYEKTLIYVDMPVLSDKEGHDAVEYVNDVTNPEEEGPLYYPHGGVKATKLTGVAAIAVAVNDLLMEQQIISLILSIILVSIVLSIIFKSIKLGLITTIPVVMVIGLEPLVMVGLNVPLNLATVMIGSSVIGAGVDFSVHITQRMKEKGLSKSAIENSVENAGPALMEATVITLAGLSAAFFIPIPAIYNFIFVIMILLGLSAVASIFVLPSILTIYARHLETKEALEEHLSEREGEWDVEWETD